jgi:hypothetical protein
MEERRVIQALGSKGELLHSVQEAFLEEAGVGKGD